MRYRTFGCLVMDGEGTLWLAKCTDPEDAVAVVERLNNLEDALEVERRRNAAPDLLAALEAMTTAFRVAVEQAAPTCNPDEHALIVRARAAIAKAKGGA